MGRKNNMLWIKGGEQRRQGSRRRRNDLDGGHLSAEGENDRHLQYEPEGVADVVGIELSETLGAVTALQEECPTHGRLPEPLLQLPRLTHEH